MQRSDGRRQDQMRPVTIIRHYLQHPEGSVLIQVGGTEVICTASIEDERPRFMKTQNIRNKGWVTAEYSMLPRSTHDRMQREITRGRAGGRTQEIQRLIGRSMRAITDLEVLGERTIWIDCDVIQADGGTRTSAITGAFIALWDACKWLKDCGAIKDVPIETNVAAISVGVIDGVLMLDLSYEEDSRADVDMNIVMAGDGRFIELQGTAEESPFSQSELDQMIGLGTAGVGDLVRLQNRIIDENLDEASIGNAQ
ncbi:TPA: ribonuclease PH [Candidatus Poribacteria bacterium]|jgi:ribonuclease PH|nr:ribonuclease PH [Candidatus Poribacteria bacterium]HIA70404.1 ribonuclease PH [Candidatus Poribacteria bacterium]HIB88382.1 ribonuclease PH [Candidatus Poribacteria bacterium]HIC02948.1 ribonuclease PH [Candidatus Poribacteria bacterium]HIN30142.1 ribonuclease PH [Candidatus Poribacteria bacterium]